MNDMNDDTQAFPNTNPTDGNPTAQPLNEPSPVAFCQNCGKSLDAATIRKVGPAVYCEPCLAAKIGAPPPPPPGYGPVNSGSPYAAGIPVMPSAPNPGLAALLGLIPGVGAMYNEQYAKGVVHLIIFAVLTSFSHVPGLGIFGLAAFGWICYMAIEAHHTAKARRDGTPLPNPFGLNDIGERMGFNGTTGPDVAGAARDAAQAAAAGFTAATAGFNKPGNTPPPQPPTGWGAPVEQYPPNPTTAYDPAWSQTVAQKIVQDATMPYTYPPYTSQPYQQTYVPPVPPMQNMPPMPPANRFPAGAIWLIALGMIFLLGTLGIFNAVPGSAFVGVTLLVIGIWLFLRRMTETGLPLAPDGTPGYQFRVLRALRGAIWLIAVGILSLLDSFRILYWSNSWPWIIILVGVFMILQRAAYNHAAAAAYVPPPPVNTSEDTHEGGK